MKAMILAAGLGTRLRPLTDRMPKALVEVGGVPMLERVILKLKNQGFDELVVNVHHFADMIIDFLNSKDFGVEIRISDEREELLDTGGGLVKAFPLLFNHNDDDVLVHNVDILSNMDLRELMDSGGNVLLVSDRDSSRKLIFDNDMTLKGWHDLKNGLYKPEGFNPVSKDGKLLDGMNEYAFSGIYMMTKKSIEEMRRLMGEGKYSVMDYFLNPNREEKIRGFLSADLKMLDIGKPEALKGPFDSFC